MIQRRLDAAKVRADLSLAARTTCFHWEPKAEQPMQPCLKFPRSGWEGVRESGRCITLNNECCPGDVDVCYHRGWKCFSLEALPLFGRWHAMTRGVESNKRQNTVSLSTERDRFVRRKKTGVCRSSAASCAGPIDSSSRLHFSEVILSAPAPSLLIQHVAYPCQTEPMHRHKEATHTGLRDRNICPHRYDPEYRLKSLLC